eukprot:TRINITY_DN4153_c0_g1_i1.p1 TRINITY_DN4153_c0_g1~~TRINITY_DN4153_c0_g1_i1.p1  ORF type:complete len:269 (-),score=39.80 TRINITY_DN4153_c0_g1_i1:330-1136(-)
MVLRTFFVAIFFLSVSTQPTELFCYNPSQEQNPFQSRTEVDALKPLVEEGKLLFQQQIDGLSIEEAGQQLPELFNETVVVLIQDVAGTDFDTISPVDVTIATFEAIINTTGGVEIIDAMLEDPNNFASLFQLVLANFDVACTESPRVTLTSVGLSMLQYFQQEPFREEVVDIINTTAVVVSKAYGVQDEIVATLEPVITTLTQTEGAGDFLKLKAESRSKNLSKVKVKKQNPGKEFLLITCCEDRTDTLYTEQQKGQVFNPRMSLSVR